ncbi:MAG TPA: MFS transporter, partial [Pseudonocardia sp.]|nr:MFS transporter [Pseudonocardia sp.]
MQRGLGLVLVAVLVTFSAQQLLTPLLAPLSREVGLTETQLGVVIAAAAVVLTVASPLWGRVVDAVGRRAALLGGLALATAGLLGFAVVAQWALGEPAARDGAVFWLFLLARSVLFGAGIAAVPVVALA